MTPEGVRDGDPDALTGLVERRGGAVLAFCEAVCDPEAVTPAAAEALARFRAAVAAADDATSLNPEVLLLGATRHAAASMARTASGGGGLRRRLRAREEEACAEVPLLLAARAEDMLDSDELDELQRHLDRCPGCRDVESAFRRAERGYRSPPERPLPADVTRELLGALASAAPLTAPGAERLLESIEGPAVEEEPELDPEPEFLPEPELVAEPEFAAEPEPVFEPEPELELEEPGHWPAPVEPWSDPDDAEPEPTASKGEHAPHDVADAEPPPAAPEPATVALAPAATTPTALPRPRRHLPHPVAGEHGPIYGYVLPGAAIAIAVAIVLAIAGVLGGDEPAPQSSQAGSALVQR